MIINNRHRQQGATLIVALVFLVVLTIAGVTAMRFTSLEEGMAGSSQFRNQAFQVAQSEIRAQLLAFNASLANRAPLLAAMSSPETTTRPSSLPVGTRDPVLLSPRLGNSNISTPNNTVRYTSERICEDGSNAEKFTCLSFEMNVQTNLPSGANSWQNQGLTFQNNK